MSSSRMGYVTNLISFALKRKRNGTQKVLDKRSGIRYNEFTKSKEWLLAHSSIRRKHNDNK